MSVQRKMRYVSIFHRVHNSDNYDCVGIFAGFRWRKLYSSWKQTKDSFSSDSANITGYHSQTLAVKRIGTQRMNALQMQSEKTI